MFLRKNKRHKNVVYNYSENRSENFLTRRPRKDGRAGRAHPKPTTGHGQATAVLRRLIGAPHGAHLCRELH